MNKALTICGIPLLLAAISACRPAEEVSDAELQALLEKLPIAKLNEIIDETRSHDELTRVDFEGHRVRPSKLLAAAWTVKGEYHRLRLLPRHEDLERALDLQRNFVPLDQADTSIPGMCPYETAAELMASCPTQEQIQQIRRDFNIYFEHSLIDHGILVPWTCTPGGDESSLMLSMYNSFRLALCIPFDESFPWAPDYDNLYEWLKNVHHIAIGYFWAEEGENSHGWNKRIYLIGNWLADPIYRRVSDPSAGVGLINYLALIAHESRHADINIGHNCGTNDTDLSYMGAWAAHYHLTRMLSENTGGYFSSSERQRLDDLAQSILDSRFCGT